MRTITEFTFDPPPYSYKIPGAKESVRPDWCGPTWLQKIIGMRYDNWWHCLACYDRFSIYVGMKILAAARLSYGSGGYRPGSTLYYCGCPRCGATRTVGYVNGLGECWYD
jgi:hypothetical protein